MPGVVHRGREQEVMGRFSCIANDDKMDSAEGEKRVQEGEEIPAEDGSRQDETGRFWVLPCGTSLTEEQKSWAGKVESG